ncbi:MAG: S8 family serine peptidase, partial [Actinomycetes bacterium]
MKLDNPNAARPKHLLSAPRRVGTRIDRALLVGFVVMTVVAGFVSSSSTAFAESALTPPAAASSVSVDPAVQADADAGGDVPVIVQFATTSDRSGDSAQQRQARRDGIAKTTDDMVKRLPRDTFAKPEAIGDLAMVSMRVKKAALASLKSNRQVVSVQSDKINHVLGTNTPNITNIGAQNAWARGFTGSGQAVAVIDTGVLTSHSFLAGKVVAEACFTSSAALSSGSTLANCSGPDPSHAEGVGTGQPCPSDVQSCEHGTHVAGIAVGGAGASFSGVAPGAGLISVRVFSTVLASPSDSYATCGGVPKCANAWDSDVIRGLLYVDSLRAAYSIAAVNMSLGGGTPTASACDGTAMATAITQLKNHGIAVVVASGNSGTKTGIMSPACVSSAISVGATNPANDTVASFSNSAARLSLLAPGVSINSSVTPTTVGSSVCPVPYAADRCAYFQGTSMATPHVAGALALLRQARPTLGGSVVNGNQVDAQLASLRSTGHPVTDTANNITTPRIQIDAAVQTLPGRPDAPTASVGDSHADVAWSAPVDDGGSSIDHYVVTPYIGLAAQTPITTPTNATSFTVTQLLNGTTYTFTITAHNAIGDGPESLQSNAVTPAVAVGQSFHAVAPVRVVDS